MKQVKKEVVEKREPTKQKQNTIKEESLAQTQIIVKGERVKQAQAQVVVKEEQMEQAQVTVKEEPVEQEHEHVVMKQEPRGLGDYSQTGPAASMSGCQPMGKTTFFRDIYFDSF